MQHLNFADFKIVACIALRLPNSRLPVAQKESEIENYSGKYMQILYPTQAWNDAPKDLHKKNYKPTITIVNEGYNGL